MRGQLPLPCTPAAGARTARHPSLPSVASSGCSCASRRCPHFLVLREAEARVHRIRGRGHRASARLDGSTSLHPPPVGQAGGSDQAPRDAGEESLLRWVRRFASLPKWMVDAPSHLTRHGRNRCRRSLPHRSHASNRFRASPTPGISTRPRKCLHQILWKPLKRILAQALGQYS